MSLPHDPQQWQQQHYVKDWQNPYEDQNGQDSTLLPSEVPPPPPPPPYRLLPASYMPLYMPKATGFSTWSTNAKITIISIVCVIIACACLLFIGNGLATGNTKTPISPINTPVPTATLPVVNPAVSNKAPTAKPKITPTQPASTHTNPTAVPQQPTPTPIPTDTPLPTPTPIPTDTPLPTPTIGA